MNILLHPKFAEAVQAGLAIAAFAVKHADKLPQAVGEAVAWAAAGTPTLTATALEERKAVCTACEHWKPIPGISLRHCAACGCPQWKLELATAKCKLGKWKATV